MTSGLRMEAIGAARASRTQSRVPRGRVRYRLQLIVGWLPTISMQLLRFLRDAVAEDGNEGAGTRIAPRSRVAMRNTGAARLLTLAKMSGTAALGTRLCLPLFSEGRKLTDSSRFAAHHLRAAG